MKAIATPKPQISLPFGLHPILSLNGIPTVWLEELTQAGSEDLPLPMVALTVAELFF
jgi:hypothetical protein